MTKKQREIITVTGKQGRGKSFLIEKYLIPNFAKTQPVIIADSMAEYKFPGMTFNQFFNQVRKTGLKKKVYKINVTSDVEAQKLFAFSCLSKIQHCLVVEEASKYCDPYKINSHLRDICRYGRHWSISAVFVAQRFAQLNKIITSQSDYFITFAQTERNDLNEMANYTDKKMLIRSLSKQEFICFGDIPEFSQFSSMPLNEVVRYEKTKNKIEEVK